MLIAIHVLIVCLLVMHVVWQFGECFYSSVCDGYVTTIVSIPCKSMQLGL